MLSGRVTLNSAPARPTPVSISTLRIFNFLARIPSALPPALRYFHEPALVCVLNVSDVIIALFVCTISPFSTVDL